MKKRFFILGIVLIYAFLLLGCNDAPAVEKSPESETKRQSEIFTQPESEVSSALNTEYFSERDFRAEYSEVEAVKITLNGDSVSCDSTAVKYSDSVLSIRAEGTYILAGVLEGMVMVEAENTDKLQLVLSGVEINSDSAAIYVKQADKVFVTLAEGSDNCLSNSGSFSAIDENDIDAVVFSKDDITFNGGGRLSISSPAGHAVVSKDSLTITEGSYDINSASSGLLGKDDVCIAGGEFEIFSGKDAIKAEHNHDDSRGFVYVGGGSFKLRAEGDGISASSFIQLDGGSYDIVAGGGSENAERRSSDMWGQIRPVGPGMNREKPPGGRPGGPEMYRPDFQMESASEEEESSNGSSMKGIKAGGAISIYGGSFSINCADDAIHSNTEITVYGGEFDICSGDDAFHAEEKLSVNGGSMDISESYEGMEALHIEIYGGKINITANDDGLNAAGGVDQSGFGGRDAMFGGLMSANSDGSISIVGGEINIVAYGDGIDANGFVDMSGGLVTVCGPSQGDTAMLDYDTTAHISGGTFIGTGGAMMAQSFSQSAQGVLALSVGAQTAGTEIIIRDSAGNEILQLTPQLDYCLVIVSTPDMVKGESYGISVGNISASMVAN